MTSIAARFIAISVAATVALGVVSGLVGGTVLVAQTAKSQSLSGTVSAVSANSMTVKSKDKESVFTIDAGTKVTAKGGGTAAKAAGGRVSIADVVRAGDTVNVNYKDQGGSLYATEVRVTVQGAASKTAR